MSKIIKVSVLKQISTEYSNNKDYQADKNVTLQLLNDYAYLFQFSSSELKNDMEIVKTAISKNPMLLQFASDNMKNNFEICKLAIEKMSASYQFIGDSLKDNVELAICMAKRGGNSFDYLSDELKDNDEVCTVAIERNGLSIQYMSERQRKNPKLCVLALKSDRKTIDHFADEAFLSDDVIYAIVRPVKGVVGVNTLSNNMPRGLFESIYSRGLKIVLVSQSINVLTIELDKLYFVLKSCDNNINRKVELLKRCIMADDSKCLQALIDKKILPTSKIQEGLDMAMQNGKVSCLPILMQVSFENGDVKKVTLTDRQKIIRSLKRRSTLAFSKVLENIKEYQDDKEVLSLAIDIDGIIICQLEKQFLNDCIIDKGIECYIAKYKEPPIMTMLIDKIDLTLNRAMALIKKDVRNWDYLGEFKYNKDIVLYTLKHDGDIYNKLTEQLKADKEIIYAKNKQ